MSDHAERLAALKDKLRARDGKKEYAESCKAIKAEIAKLELIVSASDL